MNAVDDEQADGRLKTLIQGGRLREAYDMAHAALLGAPRSRPAALDMAWVLDGYCRKLGRQGDVDGFARTFVEIMRLDVLDGDASLNKALAWRLHDLMFSAVDKPDFSPEYVGGVAMLIFTRLRPRRPSAHYSALLSAFLSLAKHDWSGFSHFCELWNFDFLRAADLERAADADGLSAPPSLGERALHAYGLRLLCGGDAKALIRHVEVMLPHLHEHPNAPLLGRTIALLLEQLDERIDTHESLLMTLLRQHSSAAWARHFVAMLPQHERDERISGLREALCGTVDYKCDLLPVRADLAVELYLAGDNGGARCEATRYIDECRECHVKPSPLLASMPSQRWYAQARP